MTEYTCDSFRFFNLFPVYFGGKGTIYISYDSTNKNSQAGDIDLVEFGHPKDDQGKEIFKATPHRKVGAILPEVI